MRWSWLLVGGRLELVYLVDGVLHRLAIQRPDVGVRLHPVMTDALLAARDVEKFEVQRLVPLPVHAQFGKSMVESCPVRAFGVGQSAVDIENEGLKGG